ncbi:MAG: hypothetical protein AAFY41_00790 [Bacteroidota bacterium]
MQTITQETNFDRVAKFYTSLSAIIIGNLIFMIYRWFEGFTLFDRQLVVVDHVIDSVAPYFAGLIAIILVNALLIVSVNVESLKNKKIAEVSAFLFSLFLNVLFWQVWQGGLEAIVFKSVISISFACLDIFFAHLFITKWGHRSEVLRSYSTVELELTEKNEEVAKLRKVSGELAKQKTALSKNVEEIKDQVETHKDLLLQTTCPECGRHFNSSEARNKHLHECHLNSMV